jgi:hypothetical protein
MQYAPPVDRPQQLQNVVSSVAGTRDDRAIKEDRFDVSRRFLPKEIKVGDTTYELRSQLVGTFLPGHIGRDGEFAVPEFFPYFVGRGHNSDQAFMDWRDQIHSRFQELYSKRPFEMTAQEAEIWQTLESIIDVPTFRKTTALTIRQIGKVTRCRPFPEQIEWEDGHKEAVRLDQMPGEFATYKPGQPFEAVTVRDPVDLHLVKVSHVRRIESLPQFSAADREALLREIPTTASLPVADWD